MICSVYHMEVDSNRHDVYLPLFAIFVGVNVFVNEKKNYCVIDYSIFKIARRVGVTLNGIIDGVPAPSCRFFTPSFRRSHRIIYMYVA